MSEKITQIRVNGQVYDIGADISDGKSAYDIAKANGFNGTEADWLESLKGAVDTNQINKQIKECFDNNATITDINKNLSYVLSKDDLSSSDVIDIDQAGATSTLTDASEYFTHDCIIAKQKGYKINDEIALALKDKKVVGGGSVVWKGWSQGWFGNLLSGEIKLDYINDPVYMSMKEPSEAISSYMSTRTSGSIMAYQPEGYNNLVGIGAFYAGKPNELPEEFTLCLGTLKVFTLGDEPNAKWKLHESHPYPNGLKVYKLPWTENITRSLKEDQIEYHDSYVRLHLKKEDLTDSVIHFWGGNKILIDLPHTKGIVVIYEAWTETENLTGDVFAAIGADQRIEGDDDIDHIKQAMSGKNFLVKKEHRLIICHSIPDIVYDELKYTPNDPSKLIDEYYKVFEKKEEEKVKTLYLDLPRQCFFGYSGDSDDYIKIATIKSNPSSSNLFVDMIFNLNHSSTATNYKEEESYHICAVSKENSITCETYSKNGVENIVACKDEENNAVNLYLHISKWMYTYFTFEYFSGAENLITFDDYFIKCFSRERITNNFTEGNTTKELVGTKLKIINLSISSNLAIGQNNAIDYFVTNPPEGSYYNFINGWDDDFYKEGFEGFMPPDAARSFYLIESTIYTYAGKKNGKQKWTNLISKKVYEKILRNDTWSSFVIATDDDYVTPERHGAIGDGVHDDSDAIQSAINSSKCVRFTTGKTYKVTKKIIVNEGVSLSGSGAKIQAVDYNSTILTLRGDNVIDGLTIFSTLDPTTDFTTPEFEADWTKRYTELGYEGIIMALGRDNIEVKNCTIGNSFCEGIKFADNKNLRVYNCKFINTDCGIITQGKGVKNLTIEGCSFEGHRFSEKISIYSEDISENILILNNRFMGDTYIATNMILIGCERATKLNAKNVEISGNTISNGFGGIALIYADDVLVTNNNIYNVSMGITTRESHNVSIISNKITKTKQHGVAITRSSYIDVINNTFTDCTFNQENISMGIIFPRNSSYVNITNNKQRNIEIDKTKNRCFLTLANDILHLVYENNEDSEASMYLGQATSFADSKIVTNANIDGSLGTAIETELLNSNSKIIQTREVVQNITGKTNTLRGNYTEQFVEKVFVTSDTINNCEINKISYIVPYDKKIVEFIVNMDFKKVNSDTLVWCKEGYVTGLNAFKFIFDGAIWREVGNVKNDISDDYMNTEYQITMDTLNQMIIDDSDRFMFTFTNDLHFNANSLSDSTNATRKGIPVLFHYLQETAKDMPILFNVFGGDYQQLSPHDQITKLKGFENVREVQNCSMSMACPSVVLAGNHEYNYTCKPGDTIGMLHKEFNKMTHQHGECIKTFSQRTKYMIDDDNKMLYIFFTSGEVGNVMRDDMKYDLVKILEKNENKYPIIAFCHYSINNDVTPMVPYTMVSTAIDIIKDKGHNIIAWIGGHDHTDNSIVYKDTLVITTLNSTVGGDHPTKKSDDDVNYKHLPNSSDEISISIFTVDKAKGKLFMTRLGAGTDHEWNYDETSGEIGRVVATDTTE